MKKRIVESMSMEEAFKSLNSKPVVTKSNFTKNVSHKKLTESSNKVKIEVKYETYGRYGTGGDIKTGRVSGSTEVEALMKMLDYVNMYIDSDYAEEFKEENGRYPTTEEIVDELDSQNGSGCDLIYWIRNLTTGEMIFDGAVADSDPEEWDDDIDEKLTESINLSWLDVQNQIALEQQKGINPFYDDSAAGNYVLELMGKVETELDVEVVPSVQGGYGDVYIHLGDIYANSGESIGPFNFTEFSNEMIDLVLEADTENTFIDAYREDILAYIENINESLNESAVANDLTNIIKTQDAEAAADWILKNTACADPRSDLVEVCKDYGCRAQIYDVLALDKAFKITIPKLTKWWTVSDEDGAFGAAWNMLLVDSDGHIYGAFAETQGAPYVYGLGFIPLEELANYLAKYPADGNYTPAEVDETRFGRWGYSNPIAKKICAECDAIFPDPYDED